MKKKFKGMTIIASILLMIGLFGTLASADHDEYEEHGDHDGYEKYEDSKEGSPFFNKEDEDYEDEEYEDHQEYENENENDRYGEQENIQEQQTSFWNIWTREAFTSLNTDLPIEEAKEVNLELGQQTKTLFLLPQNGQLLVSGEKLGQFLEADTTFYEQSKILVIRKGSKEIIVRAGTNAAYEDMTKTPMPTKALYYENSVYVPISVIANTFGYRVSWDAKKECISLDLIK